MSTTQQPTLFRSNGGAFSVVDSQNSVIKVNGKGVRISGSQDSAILKMQKILQPQFAAGASLGGRNRPLPSTAVASSASSEVSKAAQNAGVAIPAAPEQNGASVRTGKKANDDNTRFARIESRDMLDNIAKLRGKISTRFDEIEKSGSSLFSSKESKAEKAFNEFSLNIDEFKAAIQKLCQDLKLNKDPAIGQNKKVQELVEQACKANLAVVMRTLGRRIVNNYPKLKSEIKTRAAAMIADAETISKTFTNRSRDEGKALFVDGRTIN